jgi:hypothetical protein
VVRQSNSLHPPPVARTTCVTLQVGELLPDQSIQGPRVTPLGPVPPPLSQAFQGLTLAMQERWAAVSLVSCATRPFCWLSRSARCCVHVQARACELESREQDQGPVPDAWLGVYHQTLGTLAHAVGMLEIAEGGWVAGSIELSRWHA